MPPPWRKKVGSALGIPPQGHLGGKKAVWGPGNTSREATGGKMTVWAPGNASGEATGGKMTIWTPGNASGEATGGRKVGFAPERVARDTRQTTKWRQLKKVVATCVFKNFPDREQRNYLLSGVIEKMALMRAMSNFSERS